jgi:choline dehydrogenase-like flavoprotein
MTDHYDVIVIGSGAGGGTLTHALAPTGKRILLLERETSCRANRRTGTPSRSGLRPELVTAHA